MNETAQEIYDLVKLKMEESGAVDRDSFSDLVDETITYFYERGKLGEDEDDDFLKEQVMEAYDESRMGTEDGE